MEQIDTVQRLIAKNSDLFQYVSSTQGIYFYFKFNSDIFLKATFYN